MFDILQEILQSHLLLMSKILKRRVADITESNGLNLFSLIRGMNGTRLGASLYHSSIKLFSPSSSHFSNKTDLGGASL